MSIFEEVSVTFKNKEYKIPSNKVMGLVETVEDIITIEELADGKIRRAKMAKAFAAIIAYAGGFVDNEEIYTRFFDEKNGVEMAGVLNSILQLMIPPEHLQNKEETSAGKIEAQQEGDL